MQSTSPEFSTAWLKDTIYPTHKLIVEFGSNRFNDGQRTEASSTKLMRRGIDNLQAADTEFWRASDAFNNMNKNTMKWLVCDAGAKVREQEDGAGYRAVPTMLDDELSSDFERGWWSHNRSNGSGVFSSPEWVKSEFFMDDGITPFQRRVNKVTLFLTEGYDNMKVVSVEYKDEDGSWVYIASEYELDPDEYEVSWEMPDDIIITGLRATVHSTYRANDWARISELNAFWIKDISEYVISIDANEVREEYDRTVPVGTTAANTINVELDNTEGLFNEKNSDSIYAPYLGANCRVEVYFGVDKNQGVGPPDYEYVQKGEYWTDEWEANGGSSTASFSARDFSKRLQDEMLLWGRVWQNTNVVPVMRDVLLMLGLPLERIHIDDTNLRGYQVLHLHKDSPWSFFGELALADQGVFGFDSKGDFYYRSYHTLNDAPYDTPVVNLDWNQNIIDGSIRTQLYVNKVKVNVSPYDEEKTVNNLWSPESPTILSYAKLSGNISASDTTINVKAAARQSNGNLTDNGWVEKGGYLFLPKFQTVTVGGEQRRRVVGGELIKYKSRTDSAFLDCERGYLDTVPQAWSSDSYIGEARVWDIEFSNAPAFTVKYPYVTAIDTLLSHPDEGEAQAHIVHWENNAFSGKLCIANIVEFLTWLSGTGETLKWYQDPDREEITFATSVGGEVYVQKTNSQESTKSDTPSAENENFVRRYGKNEIEIDNEWIQTKAHAEDIAEAMIDEYRSPRSVVEVDVVASPAIELSDRVVISNYPQLDIENTEYHVIGASYSYDGGLRTRLTLREVKD